MKNCNYIPQIQTSESTRSVRMKYSEDESENEYNSSYSENNINIQIPIMKTSTSIVQVYNETNLNESAAGILSITNTEATKTKSSAQQDSGRIAMNTQIQTPIIQTSFSVAQNHNETNLNESAAGILSVTNTEATKTESSAQQDSGRIAMNTQIQTPIIQTSIPIVQIHNDLNSKTSYSTPNSVLNAKQQTNKHPSSIILTQTQQKQKVNTVQLQITNMFPIMQQAQQISEKTQIKQSNISGSSTSSQNINLKTLSNSQSQQSIRSENSEQSSIPPKISSSSSKSSLSSQCSEIINQSQSQSSSSSEPSQQISLLQQTIQPSTTTEENIDGNLDNNTNKYHKQLFHCKPVQAKHPLDDNTDILSYGTKDISGYTCLEYQYYDVTNKKTKDEEKHHFICLECSGDQRCKEDK